MSEIPDEEKNEISQNSKENLTNCGIGQVALKKVS